MIGRFFENLIILKQGYDIKNYVENDFFKLDNDKIILFKNAYGLKNGNIETLQNKEYKIDEFEKIVITEKLNKKSFLNDVLYENEKFILLKNLKLKYKCKTFKTTYSSFKEAEEFFSSFSNNPTFLLVFNELFFNAYEHGNLALSFEEKEDLIRNDKYMDFLKNKSVDKNIEVCVARKKGYIFVKITDEGEGFEFSEKSPVFNGRGIKMCEKFVYLFYNEKGNSVLFIGKENEF